MSYPKQSDPLYSNIISFAGIVDDLHFSSYLLEAGEGEAPMSWKRISSGTSPVKGDVLGEWNSYGAVGTSSCPYAPCKWSFRLTATDSVGNTNISTTVLDIGPRDTLIKALSPVAARLFTNNDTKLDTTTVSYAVSDAVGIRLEMIDSANAVKSTITATVPSRGAYSTTWNGGKTIRERLYLTAFIP